LQNFPQVFGAKGTKTAAFYRKNKTAQTKQFKRFIYGVVQMRRTLYAAGVFSII
jgi:hypothetical protein